MRRVLCSCVPTSRISSTITAPSAACGAAGDVYDNPRVRARLLVFKALFAAVSLAHRYRPGLLNDTAFRTDESAPPTGQSDRAWSFVTDWPMNWRNWLVLRGRRRAGAQAQRRERRHRA